MMSVIRKFFKLFINFTIFILLARNDTNDFNVNFDNALRQTYTIKK